VKELLAHAGSTPIRGIGASGQQHGLVVLDEKNEVIRPAKLWCDTSTAAEAAELTKLAGYSVPTGFTLPKLLWMKRNEPQNFARIRHVLLPHDYINFLLSGSFFMECGDASGSGAFLPEKRTFDDKLLAAVDPKAREWFPNLIAPDLPGGKLSESAAKWLGLPAGIVVAPGGGDNMMSAIGSGATKAGVVVASLGTSGTAFAYSDKPIVDPAGEIAAFCDSTGAWMPLLCTMNMTNVTEEVRDAFGLSHEELTNLARKVNPGADGLTFLPYLVGERVPNLPHATGALVGLRPGLLNPGHAYRAAIEGATLGLASGILRLMELGLKVGELRVVGGGSKNPLWRQILSEAVGAPVRGLVEPESAALGGAVQALWVARRAAGEKVTADQVAAPFIELSPETTTPDPKNVEHYAKQLQQFRALTRSMYQA
jgi:xylulokinase